MKDMMVKTHHGSHIQFSLHFVKTGIFPAEISEIPQRVESLRLKGDYESGQIITKDDAELSLANAGIFYDKIKEYFDAVKA